MTSGAVVPGYSNDTGTANAELAREGVNDGNEYNHRSNG
jgi:hypothetical protein